MLKVFQSEILDPGKFIVTLELVPGRYSSGKSMDTVKAIACDSFADGRIAAVSVTDNPGGNPSLSPDVLGRDIFQVGMDVILHFASRDLNRVGMESRALQLAMMGMKNILAVTGDYTGKGFGGQGAPVFDLESVSSLMLLRYLSRRLLDAGDPDGFFAGCAVSPFKRTEAECFAQYAKLARKIAAGAQFIITQLGYDARKFAEVMHLLRQRGWQLPIMGSVYMLTPKAATIMNRGLIPGAVVTDKLLAEIRTEWETPAQGRRLAIERAAKLGAVLKGLGYRGMHIGGVHSGFDTVGKILDRMREIEGDWQDFYCEFDYPQQDGFYVFPRYIQGGNPSEQFGRAAYDLPLNERMHYSFLKTVHDRFFSFTSPLAPVCGRASRWIDEHKKVEKLASCLENTSKRALLDCQHCGDCGIQHVGFLCPESQCPKHTRNGQCGGSRDGQCEVYPNKPCVWVRAHGRLAFYKATDTMASACVPPRRWELNKTNSWLNFHLKRDHQGVPFQQDAPVTPTSDCGGTETDLHQKK
ncbi:MAG: methylenetetrahydrofolate reductase C-terminal domain-containing protein [Desulfocapsaceae bacterium]|nr:methylenetetrahydrofolate reductase C-terminal domain-containing protein [Desulfocapsaceae bacterium]